LDIEFIKNEIKGCVEGLALSSVIESNIDASDEEKRNIPLNVRDEVWRRDQGKCVKCGSREKLEFDHIIPYQKVEAIP
jgi:5-methylcytosine-specific restriction endonuclease McrA